MDKRNETFKSRDEALEPLTATSKRLRGIVVRMLPDKGFGFVHVAGTEAEYFMHRSAFVADPTAFDRLRAGVQVSFTWEMTAKGPRAFNVEVI